MIPSLKRTAISPKKKKGWQVGRLSIVFVSFWGVGRHGLFSPANCPVSFREKLVGKPTHPKKNRAVSVRKNAVSRCWRSKGFEESPFGPPTSSWMRIP